MGTICFRVRMGLVQACTVRTGLLTPPLSVIAQVKAKRDADRSKPQGWPTVPVASALDMFARYLT
jgi:hypothetical protein